MQVKCPSCKQPSQKIVRAGAHENTTYKLVVILPLCTKERQRTESSRSSCRAIELEFHRQTGSMSRKCSVPCLSR